MELDSPRQIRRRQSHRRRTMRKLRRNIYFGGGIFALLVASTVAFLWWQENGRAALNFNPSLSETVITQQEDRNSFSRKNQSSPNLFREGYSNQEPPPDAGSALTDAIRAARPSTQSEITGATTTKLDTPVETELMPNKVGTGVSGKHSPTDTRQSSVRPVTNFNPSSGGAKNSVANLPAFDSIGHSAFQSFDRMQILSDYKNRIGDEFTVPKNLRDRAGFWFDVYSRYDENKRIIHNARFPWVIYKIVDVSGIINAPTPRRRWMRNQKADLVVDAEARKIRAAVKSLAHRKSLKGLNKYEELVANGLRALGPDVRRFAGQADGFTRVQIGQRNFFEDGLRVSPRYLPEMEEIFAARKLPIELTRLPFVESSFNKHATSKVGASGIWQFMGNTGTKFMMVNDQIDERRSPFKATEAAARLLKENWMILYRSWALALTAYNHGPAGVRKAAQRAGTRDLGLIIQKYQSKSFNFASSNFYCEFLGALHAQTYRDEIWGQMETEVPMDTHIVRLPRAYRPSQLLRLIGLTSDQLLSHNPDLAKSLKLDRFIPRGFRFHVPGSLRVKASRLLVRTDETTSKASEKKTRRSRS